MSSRKPNLRRHGRDMARRYGDNYQCSHCCSKLGGVTRDECGIWHAEIRHDETCPVLAGTLPSLPDATRAVRRTGEPILIVERVGDSVVVLRPDAASRQFLPLHKISG